MAKGVGSRDRQEKLYAAAKQGLPEQMAPCRHYRSCGGCDLQELSYEHQLEAKKRSLTLKTAVEIHGGSSGAIRPPA